jgi:glycosyltransferase involved in cell wall biosynthesis
LVVYNGVDLNHFCPSGDSHRSAAETCIASVEGTQGTDPYDMAVGLTRALAAKGMHVELLVCGKPWKDTESRFLRHSFVRFLGVIPNADLPRIYRAAALMISTDIIAACPNSVIEALACGTPVLGYDRGVLPELVRASAGKCVPSIGEVGKGTFAGNTEALVEAALDLIARQDFYRSGARRLAEESHDLDRMIDAYIKALLP